MSNEFEKLPDTNLVNEQVDKAQNKRAVDVVNLRLKSAMSTLRELGFSPTTEDNGLQSVLQLASMYERQAEGF